MPTDRTDAHERLARIEQMIQEDRGTKQRQVLKRAIKLLRKAEVQQQLMDFEALPERVH